MQDLTSNFAADFTAAATTAETTAFLLQEWRTDLEDNHGAGRPLATIPMSHFEATGLSGDVPFVIRFPAPPDAPFVVPAGAGPIP